MRFGFKEQNGYNISTFLDRPEAYTINASLPRQHKDPRFCRTAAIRIVQAWNRACSPSVYFVMEIPHGIMEIPYGVE
jgi:hypothetical protein